MSSAIELSPRLVLYHKQSTSGRVRFLTLPTGVILFEPLPDLASLREEENFNNIFFHPTPLIHQAEALFKLPSGAIAAENPFRAWVDAPKGNIPIILAAFTTIDPPFEAVKIAEGSFIALTETCSLRAIERDILRLVYEHVLG